MKNIIVTILLSAVLALTVTGQTRSVRLVGEIFTVGAGYTRSWSFRSPNCVNITGAFRAKGGNQNDIKVLVMDALAFENWKNGHTVQTYYNSGQITTADFSVNLNKAGDFVIVFSNIDGFVQRSVNASVGLYPCRRR
jgi:hypothetical protein